MTEQAQVLLVDDDEAVLMAGRQTLELAGFAVTCFDSAEQVLDHVSPGFLGVLVTDIRMPRVDGLTLMRQALDVDGDLPVVVVTGHGDVPTAVAAMRDGAYDFLEKPFAAEHLVDVIRRATEKRRLVLENRLLRTQLDGNGLDSVLIGKTDAIETLRNEIRTLAATDADIVIMGETGSGKELVARCLHEHGHRAKGPLVSINCGAIPEQIIEAELFGYEAGAFTGAAKQRVGRLEYASGGTVFLDEIESMPIDLQVKLLRVIEERALERLGSNTRIDLDIRILAASKVDLLAACERGQFRHDLYFRLNVVQLRVPPLRERIADVPLLFALFVARACERHRRDPPGTSPGTTADLLAYAWPGNVREFKNAAERHALGLALGLAADDAASLADGTAGAGLSERVKAFEKDAITRELLRQNGNVTATCDALKLPRKTLYDKMQKYGLRRDAFVGDQEKTRA